MSPGTLRFKIFHDLHLECPRAPKHFGSSSQHWLGANGQCPTTLLAAAGQGEHAERLRAFAEEQQEIASALARIPKQPLFSPDFEVDRGRSTLEERPDFFKTGSSAQFSSDSGTADWVRIRREFSVQAAFSTVQYSFSHDPKNMVETSDLPRARSQRT